MGELVDPPDFGSGHILGSKPSLATNGGVAQRKSGGLSSRRSGYHNPSFPHRAAKFVKNGYWSIVG